MDYIINPMWFYWLGVVDGIWNACLIISIISAIALVFTTALAIKNYCDGEEVIYHHLKKASIIGVIVFIVSSIGCVFIPSRETLICMMVAKQATFTNVGLTVNAIKDAVDYVVQAIQSIN